VSVRATPGVAQRPITINSTHTSTRNYSTAMAPINDALAAIEALDPGEKLVYQKIADQYGVDRSTLARRHKGVQVPREAKDFNQQKLTQQQEEELVKYIQELTARHIPAAMDQLYRQASSMSPPTTLSNHAGWRKLSQRYTLCLFPHRLQAGLTMSQALLGLNRSLIASLSRKLEESTAS
jgi:hypothetical protein